MAHYSSLTALLVALALTACGGGSTAVDLAPTFSSGSTFTVAEGSADVATITASDPEGRAVRYSLVNGEDSALFSLSSQGQLRFLQAPDYETPLDLTANNRYSLGVTASDGGNSTALTLTVNVIDALEGRVVDGPLAGSLVFRDLDGDFELDTGEPQTTTDSDGFFLLDDSEVNCDQLNSCGLNVVAYGGTDTSTNTLLSDFVLAGQLQRNQEFIISPISTLLTGTDDALRLLSGLQLSVSPEQLALFDPWQLAENNQGSLLARNQQIGLLVQTLITVLSVDPAVTPLQVTLELVSVISGLVETGDLDLDLGDELLVTEILNNALAGFPSSSALDTEALAAVGGKLAMINRSLVEIQEDLTADFAVAVVRAAQTDLQRSVAALSGNEISVEQFLQATAAEALFADVPENLDLANTDGDDLADFLDQDDDNDLVLDRVDWSPLDPSEWVDSDGDEIGDNADPDDDNDSVVDAVDAFPFDAAEFLDTDGDRQGNNGDLDDDNDSVADGDDAFPLDADESVDTDGDSIGNNADPDDDNDAVLDEADAFPLDASESLDTDGDGIGNNADLDDDGDGHMDGNDALPLDVSEWLDTDGDEIGNNSDPDDDNDNVADVDDALPLDPSESVDTDGDEIGNNADPDDDNDAVLDVADAFRLDANESVDTDGDEIGNNADPDDDNDGVLDEADAFRLDANESVDTDGDGIGNNADPDDDNDAVLDGADAFPLDVSEWLDTDGDDIGNNSDPDDDNDGVLDGADAFRLDANESVDTDGDEIGNNADPDDDNDAVLDGADAFPLDVNEWLDTDGDEIGNNSDLDDDNDNVADVDDALPLDPSESVDTDGDEIGNNSDPDDDGDGFMDGNDAFPLDGSEWLDTDGDEIGNNADPDDDNDSVLDRNDAFPLNASESLDTDGDEIGNNTDNDDDGDGVNDARDDAPLDASITPPTALFYADQLQGPAPLVVLFDASDTVAGYLDDSVVSFSWDFGDGSSGSGISVSHTFESAGTFAVVLTVLNTDGLSHVFSESVMVSPGSYSVSGVISVADSARSDSDVNDLASTFVINSSFSRAQLLDVPANVIGYVNTANYGPSGKTFSAGDPRDYYQFEALGGEVINLILDSPGGTAAGYTDLDMYLYDADNDLVGYSIGETQYESLMIPLAQGTYYLRVNVWTSSEGAGKYYLSIGAGLTSLGSGWSSDTEFAVGDVIVKERPSKTRSVSNIARAAATPSAVRSMGRSGPKLYRYGQNIGRQSDGLTKGARSASLTAPSEIDMQVATLLAAKELSLDPAVEYAEPNFLRRSTQIPTDERYGIQWHYEQIRLPEAWDITTGSADVKVAVLDTGIFIAHPDLEARLSDDGFDFINNAYNAGDGEEVNEDSNGNGLLDPGEDLDGDGYLDDGQEIDNDANDPGDGADNPYCSESIGSSSFHGTHVAGTIGAETNNDDDSEDINGNGIIDLGEDIDSDGIIDTAGDGVGNGIAGVTWAGEIMNLRVLGCEGGYDFDIANAIRYAAGLENQSGIIVEDPADIANMSLGGGGTSLTLTRAIADATEAGLIIIAAAGNSATELPSYPAAYSNVISVSATLDDDSLASYSNYGATVDVSAPGSKIKSTLAEFNLDEQKMKASYASYNGTSMAAPHVAGVVSLMKSVYPQMSPSEFDAILLSGEITLDLGEAGRDDLFGAGRMDAAKAVEFVKALADGMRVIPVTPVLYLDKSYLNYGKTIGQYSINASNFGNGNLAISSVSAADAFVTVSEPQENAGIYTYTVGIDRSDLADGIYSSTVSFTSNGGDVDVSLVFQVMSSNLSSEGDLGNISVILKDINSGAEIPLQIQSAAAGQYSYSIDGVEQGVYEIHSGTDIDNDGVICGIAEACGAYPTLMSPATVIVNGNVENLDFSLEIDGSAYSE